MRIMAEWLQQFQKFVNDAREVSERETILCQLDEIKIHRQDLTDREIELMRQLRKLDGLPERREPCQALAGLRTFSNRNPGLSEELRLPSQACTVLPFGRNEVRSVKS